MPSDAQEAAGMEGPGQWGSRWLVLAGKCHGNPPA